MHKGVAAPQLPHVTSGQIPLWMRGAGRGLTCVCGEEWREAAVWTGEGRADMERVGLEVTHKTFRESGFRSQR